MSHYSDTNARFSHRKEVRAANTRANWLILHVAAGIPLVKATGGQCVTEEFFDNDNRLSSRAGNCAAGYDFIHGEPYGAWV